MRFKTFLFLICGTLSVRCQKLLVAPSTSDENVTEAPACSVGEFRCNDGVCVAGLARCNGTVECPDQSDETFVLCRNDQCPTDQFRCAYGACVHGTACNGVQDCADNSDEKLTRCLPETNRTICQTSIGRDGQFGIVCSINTDCENGELLSEEDKCNGKVDCEDGSDETIGRCAEGECKKDTFRCAYGGCAHQYAMCNGVADCADGSDESNALCNRTLMTDSPKTVDEVTTANNRPVCILPPQPDHGRYVFIGKLDAVPGQEFSSFVLQFTCEPGYGIVGLSSIFCFNGDKSGEYPKCVRFCKLPKHPSVEYRCPLPDEGSLEGTRECEESEPDGTTVQPRCRQPVYYYPGILFDMHCNDGRWDNIIVCTPECGKLGSTVDALLVGKGARDANRNELPWHVAIYRKKWKRQICGGTVVSENLVISAAHCFWDDVTKLQPTSNYMIAAGKLYRAWGHPNDTHAQTSDIREIKIPARFQGATTNFQDDIALLILMTNLEYTLHVRPVCIDFDTEFDTQQLQKGSVGKVAGWGRTSETSGYSEVLRVTDMPYVTIDECIADIPIAFEAYITSDKICAGYKNGTALCEGDSGGGLTFPARERGSIHYFLRGVASTAFNDEHLCNSATITSFTHVASHDIFIQDHL